MSDKVVYIGKDLEAMSFAVNYHKWILREFRPYLGSTIVEVGAGTGGFSKLLLDENPDSLTLIEPSVMFAQLRDNVRSETTTIDYYHNIFAEVADELRHSNRPDSILYNNVLEHIEDDRAELKLIYETLAPGGKALIFVPALQQLYGEFDRQIGHFRRYTKKELVAKVGGAGFRILKVKYFDLAGIVPWFVKYKIFGSDSLESGAVELYDKFAVPVTSAFESLITPPLGKNLLIVGEKA